MNERALDAIDQQILAILQADGRITNVALAERLGLSPPPCLRRVKALEERGYITGYQAQINASKLGFGVTAFAFVGLSSQAETDLNAFETLANSWPEVRSCYRLSGEIDYILKIVAQDLERFQGFINQKLTGAANVSQVKTSLCIKASVMKPGVPLEID